MIAYSETDKRLAIRIRAHKEFANFQMEDWLYDKLRLKPGGKVLDIACGNGNYFPIYSSKIRSNGLIIGIDLSDSLLDAARSQIAKLDTAGLIIKWNFDNAYPFLNKEFNATLCFYGAYYARNAQSWVDEAMRVTHSDGQIILVGPADDNAAELYELNAAVTGISTIQETNFTSGRLTREFLPAFNLRLKRNLNCEILERQIIFPSAHEFAQYYLATWLYEKTAEQLGRSFTVEEVEKKVRSCSLSKRVAVIDVTVP